MKQIDAKQHNIKIPEITVTTIANVEFLGMLRSSEAGAGGDASKTGVQMESDRGYLGAGASEGT